MNSTKMGNFPMSSYPIFLFKIIVSFSALQALFPWNPRALRTFTKFII